MGLTLTAFRSATQTFYCTELVVCCLTCILYTQTSNSDEVKHLRLKYKFHFVMVIFPYACWDCTLISFFDDMHVSHKPELQTMTSSPHIAVQNQIPIMASQNGRVIISPIGLCALNNIQFAGQ